MLLAPNLFYMHDISIKKMNELVMLTLTFSHVVLRKSVSSVRYMEKVPIRVKF